MFHDDWSIEMMQKDVKMIRSINISLQFVHISIDRSMMLKNREDKHLQWMISQDIDLFFILLIRRELTWHVHQSSSIQFHAGISMNSLFFFLCTVVRERDVLMSLHDICLQMRISRPLTLLFSTVRTRSSYVHSCNESKR